MPPESRGPEPTFQKTILCLDCIASAVSKYTFLTWLGICGCLLPGLSPFKRVLQAYTELVRNASLSDSQHRLVSPHNVDSTRLRTKYHEDIYSPVACFVVLREPTLPIVCKLFCLSVAAANIRFAIAFSWYKCTPMGESTLTFKLPCGGFPQY